MYGSCNSVVRASSITGHHIKSKNASSPRNANGFYVPRGEVILYTVHVVFFAVDMHYFDLYSYFYSSVRESSYARLWCATVDNLLIEEGEKGHVESGGMGKRGRRGRKGYRRSGRKGVVINA